MTTSKKQNTYAQCAAALLAALMPTLTHGAETISVEERLNQLEKSVQSLQKENSDLKNQLGYDGKTPLVIARPGLVYGPGDRHLLGWYRAIQRGYYRVVGVGTNHLHPVYIDDLIDALLRCQPRATPDGRAYHLVGERAYTMRELSDAIGRAVGRQVPSMPLPTWLAWTAGALFEMLPVARRRLPLSRTRVTFLCQNREYDGTRAHDELGFVPQVPLEDGLSRAVVWYRQHGWL